MQYQATKPRPVEYLESRVPRMIHHYDIPISANSEMPRASRFCELGLSADLYATGIAHSIENVPKSKTTRH